MVGPLSVFYGNAIVLYNRLFMGVALSPKQQLGFIITIYAHIMQSAGNNYITNSCYISDSWTRGSGASVTESIWSRHTIRSRKQISQGVLSASHFVLYKKKCPLHSLTSIHQHGILINTLTALKVKWKWNYQELESKNVKTESDLFYISWKKKPLLPLAYFVIWILCIHFSGRATSS